MARHPSIYDYIIVGAGSAGCTAAAGLIAREAGSSDMHPVGKATTLDEMRTHVRSAAGTAYYPVGTLRMGTDKSAPVTPTLQVRGGDALWAADASIMPAVTSANTNAPCMMIGHRAASFIVG